MFDRLDPHRRSASAGRLLDPPRRSTRIIGPENLEDGFDFAKRKDKIEALLARIEKIYRQEELDKEAWSSGCCSCVGLLDPSANIRVNLLVSEDVKPPPAQGGQEAGSMIQRSLDGLMAFLTCLFPYLPDAEALAYLEAAGAHPLVAALLIMDRRGLTVSSFITEAAVEIALRSAAVAAKHPDPQRFVRGWKLVSRMPDDFRAALSDGNKFYYKVVRLTLRTSSDLQLNEPSSDLQLKEPSSDLQLEGMWKLARDRLPSQKALGTLLQGLPPARATMKRLLLSMIHAFYLKALSALPKKELTSSYHRSLLFGGHCYGPLDPVSNIIINTVWYELTFPFPEGATPSLNMISTKCLWRIAARSLYGLVSFLCSRDYNLTPDLAVQRLLEARANLFVADGMGTGQKETGLLEAYAAAATAAFHPSPVLHKDFLGSLESVQAIQVISEMLSVQDGGPISKQKFDCLLLLLQCSSSAGKSHPQQYLEPKRVTKRVYTRCSHYKSRFWGRHERIISMVEAVLGKFNETTVHKYELHVICGVNELVDREFCTDDREVRRSYNPWTPHKYHYSHINFLAICEGFPDNPAKLFFAECSNHDGSGTSWCVPVQLQPDAGITRSGIRPEVARCIYCEHEGSKILHSIMENFHGRDDFEKLFDGGFYTNDNLIERNEDTVDWVHAVDDDAIYLNYDDTIFLNYCVDPDGSVSMLGTS